MSERTSITTNNHEQLINKHFSKNFSPIRCKFEHGYVIKEHIQQLARVLAEADGNLSTYDLVNVCDYLRLYEGQELTDEHLLARLDQAVEDAVNTLINASNIMNRQIVLANTSFTHFLCSTLDYNGYCMLMSGLEKKLDLLQNNIDKDLKIQLVKTKTSEGKREYYIVLKGSALVDDKH